MPATFKLGKNFRLEVGAGDGPPETFNVVGGEGTLKIGGNSDNIDLSSKDDGQYKSMAMGQSAQSISLDGVCHTPDTGLSALDAAFKSGAPINIKVVDNTVPATPRNAFVASVYVGNKNADMTNNQAVKYSFTLSLNGAPTTDDVFG